MCAAVYTQRHLVKATDVTANLAESNGSLLPGLWRDSLHVTCGLTACTPGSAPGQTLGNEYGKLYLFTARCYASAVLAMALCLSVSFCVSVTSRSSTKTAKLGITETTTHDSPGTLVF